MKIAFFSDCYLDLTGGIVTSINAQKAELEKRGHEVYVFSTGFPKSKPELKKLIRQNIYQVPSCKVFLRGLAPVSRRPKIIEKWILENFPEIKDFDIFYIHYESGCSIAGLRLGKKLHVPTVQVMHGREDMGEESLIPLGFRTIVAVLLNWFHSWYIPHEIAVSRDSYLADTIAKTKMWSLMVNHANYADYVLTPSNHFSRKLKHYGVKKKIRIFPNGFLDSNFLKNPKIKELMEGEELHIIWHSRVSGEKRIMVFLEALTKVKIKYRLDVYGNGSDLIKAKFFSKKNHLNVFFHGNTKHSKVQSAINNSHLDVLASYNYDNYPLTLVEAEAAGVPVLICDPDMREIVPDGSFLLSASESSESIAGTINKLAKYPEKIRQMSEIMLKNRKEVLISNRIKILEEFFNGIIKK